MLGGNGKIAYLAVVVSMIVLGVLTLALQNVKTAAWVKSKTTISLILGAVAVLVFMISSQPYAAVFAFALLAIKALMLIKRGSPETYHVRDASFLVYFRAFC